MIKSRKGMSFQSFIPFSLVKNPHRLILKLQRKFCLKRIAEIFDRRFLLAFPLIYLYFSSPYSIFFDVFLHQPSHLFLFRCVVRDILSSLSYFIHFFSLSNSFFHPLPRFFFRSFLLIWICFFIALIYDS